MIVGEELTGICCVGGGSGGVVRLRTSAIRFTKTVIDNGREREAGSGVAMGEKD